MNITFKLSGNFIFIRTESVYEKTKTFLRIDEICQFSICNNLETTTLSIVYKGGAKEEFKSMKPEGVQNLEDIYELLLKRLMVG